MSTGATEKPKSLQVTLIHLLKLLVSSSAVPADMAEERIVTFTIKELSLKLQYGHSVSEFEHHLQNTVDIFGGKLFTKWAEVTQIWLH